MKTVAIQGLRGQIGRILRGSEPVLVTRYGKPAGVFYPLPDQKKLPQQLGDQARKEPRSKHSKKEPPAPSESQLQLGFDSLLTRQGKTGG